MGLKGIILCREKDPVLLLNGPFAIFQLNFFSWLGAVAVEAGKNFPHHREIPFGKQSTRALNLSMKDARVSKDEVGYINFHGTSTVLNDKIETLAVKQAFNSHAMKIPSSSTKSMIGHPQGASGAMGVTVSVLSLQNGFLTPTINIENPDPECDMDYISNVGKEN